MELPQPPKDTDLRNIIDKLAQFVARNGPEFEQMTKSKQRNNPKFSFLYGGEHYNYYQYKVTTEQAILKQSAGRRDVGFMSQSGQYNMPPQGSNVGPPPVTPGLDAPAPIGAQPNLSQWVTRQLLPDRPAGMTAATFTATAIEVIVAQQATLREQIKQSESNLNAQHSVLIQQQQSQMEDTVATAQAETIQKLAADNNVNLAEFDGILQPIIDSCTKDSISAGKGWILNHASSREAGLSIAQYLLKKVTAFGAAFTQKLHVIYLINDVLHHCARKNADDLRKSLESVVVPMFCNASIAITEEQETKLNKLLKLWESKSNYFDQSVIEKMKDPTNSYQEYTASLISLYANLITPLTQQTKITFENYQKQHQAFVSHTLQQIQQLEMQKQIIEQQINHSQLPPEQNNITPQNFDPPPCNDQIFTQPGNIMQRNPIPNFEPPGFCNNNPPFFPQGEQPPLQPPPYGPSNGMQTNSNDNGLYDFDPPFNQNSNQPITNTEDLSQVNLSQPPPGFFDGGVVPPSFQNGMPDLSKPPPGFTTPEVCPDDLLPSVPYFELPAGLMVPLIMLEDSEYKPLDPDAIKLPPPAPPSDRLIAAVDAFYAKPDHIRPQDRPGWTAGENARGENNKEHLQLISDGWETLGLYEYYRAKAAAKKLKDDNVKSGVREKSRSPSPIVLEHFPFKSLPIRRYRSKSRSPSRERSRSKSPPPRNRSITPEREDRVGRRANRRGRRNSPNNSSPPPHSPNRSYNRRGSPENDERVAAEEFHNKNERIDQSNASIVSELDSSNKGHKMLRKMGWTQGAGLGATGQGITAPISASTGDKEISRDPYENFRKNKGAAFITRMKERALERSS